MIDAAEIAAIAAELELLQRRLAAALDGAGSDVAGDPLPHTTPPVAPAGDWIKARDAARLCGVHPQTIRRWAIEGEITGHRGATNTWRILKASLAPFLPQK
jgi:excisionase family DNA binding protein